MTKRRDEQNGVCRTARARSGGKCRNAAARKDRLTAEVRGPKWFDVKNELNEQERETETDKDGKDERRRQPVTARQRGRRKRLREPSTNTSETKRERALERDYRVPSIKEGIRPMVGGTEGWLEAKEGEHPTIFHCPRMTSTTFDCFRL